MKSLIRSFLQIAVHLRGLGHATHGPKAASVPPQRRPANDVISYSFGPDGVAGEYGSGEHSDPDLGRYGVPAGPDGDDPGQ